jgi:hypothetical protein
LDGLDDLIQAVFDGDRDSATFLDGRFTQILMNRGDGSLVDETPARLPAQTDGEIGATDYHLADLDGDGDLDLPTGTFDERLFYENDGLGTFTAKANDVPDIEWFYIPLDIDGDGLGIDFVYARRSADTNDETAFYLVKRQ